MTYEQAVRLWRLAKLVRDHQLAPADRAVSLLFQDTRIVPWDDIAETRADGCVVGWQIKNLSEPLPDATLQQLLKKLAHHAELRAVLALSQPVLRGPAVSIVGLQNLCNAARAAGGDLSRWELRDDIEQRQLDAVSALAFGETAGGTGDTFRLLTRLRVEFLGTRSELISRAVDMLGRFFAEPEVVLARLRDEIVDDGIRGVRIDYPLLEQRVLAACSAASSTPSVLPAPGPGEREYLLWTSDHRGVGQTIWVSAAGKALAQVPDVIVSTNAHAWRLEEMRVAVPMLQCSPFDDFDYDNPPVEVSTVRASALRDIYSGATIQLSLIAPGEYSWLLDAAQQVTLLGGINNLLLVRIQLWLDGGGARPEYETAFRALDLERGGREVALWDEGQARRWETGVGLAAVNAMRSHRSLIEPDPFTDCKLTQGALRIDNELRVKARLQFTADVCHADADESWDDYSASELVDVDDLPSKLRESGALPAPLLRYWSSNPLPGVPAGWSPAPASPDQREALWAVFRESD